MPTKRIKNIEIITSHELLPEFLLKNSGKTGDFNLNPQKSSGLFMAEYGGYFLIYNPLAQNRRLVLLNNKAKDILDLCDGKRAIKEIFQILSLRKTSMSLQDLFHVIGCFLEKQAVYTAVIGK